MTDPMPTVPFTVRLDVRSYDLDPQLHVNGAVYQQYADHSRLACVQAAGLSLKDLIDSGVGPVNLETLIKYHHELRGGDQVDVSCVWKWGEGKTYRVEHTLSLPDDTVVADISNVSGLLDLNTRRLLAHPADQWRERVQRPELLGLR